MGFFTNASVMPGIGANAIGAGAIGLATSLASTVGGFLGAAGGGLAGGIIGGLLGGGRGATGGAVAGGFLGLVGGIVAGISMSYNAADDFIEENFGKDANQTELSSAFHGEMADGYLQAARHALTADAAEQGVQLVWEQDLPAAELAPTVQSQPVQQSRAA